jgi:hypothetical protein
VSLGRRAVRRPLFLWASAGLLAGVYWSVGGLLAVLMMQLIRGPVGRVGIVGDGSGTSIDGLGWIAVGADPDGQQAACRSYGPSESPGPCPRGRHARRKPPERPAGGHISQAGGQRWSGGGSRGAPSSASWPTGQERLGPVAARAWAASSTKAAGVLLTGQVGATPTRTRTGLGLPRTRQAGWNRDSDPAAPTTSQVHGCVHVLILPLDSAVRPGPRVQPAIPASGVNPSASSAKQATVRCWLCSFALYFQPC